MTTASAIRARARREAGSARPPLPWLLRRVNQRYRAAVRAALARSGLSELPQPGYWALMVLAQGGSDAGRLVREMGVSKQAVSKLIDTLVTTGFVERRPNEADRRRSQLLLSPKGRRAASFVEEAVLATDESFITDLGAASFELLGRMLARLGR